MIFMLHEIHAVLVFLNDSWKSSVIYFMWIYNAGILLVSDGKILCDLILRALMTRMNMFHAF